MKIHRKIILLLFEGIMASMIESSKKLTGSCLLCFESLCGSFLLRVGSLIASIFVMSWKLVGVGFCCFESFVGSTFGVLGACRAHFWGLGGFVWLLGVQDMSKGPPWKHFGMFWCPFGRHLGSHLGVVLVLCCNFLEIFLGRQIHSYLQGVRGRF